MLRKMLSTVALLAAGSIVLAGCEVYLRDAVISGLMDYVSGQVSGVLESLLPLAGA